MPIIRNEKIARDGWKTQATCDDPRLSEMANWLISRLVNQQTIQPGLNDIIPKRYMALFHL